MEVLLQNCMYPSSLFGNFLTCTLHTIKVLLVCYLKQSTMEFSVHRGNSNLYMQSEYSCSIWSRFRSNINVQIKKKKKGFWYSEPAGFFVANLNDPISPNFIMGITFLSYCCRISLFEMLLQIQTARTRCFCAPLCL